MKKKATEKPNRPRKNAANAQSVNGGSREARQLSAVILEVLAGVRTPTDAAKAVGLSVSRYYMLETRALQGLVAACEPRKTGKRRPPEKVIASLKNEIAKLKRECERTNALLRLSHRTLAVAAPRAEKPKDGGGKNKRRRRPQARALAAAASMREGSTESGAGAKEPAPHGPPRQEGGRHETGPTIQGR